MEMNFSKYKGFQIIREILLATFLCCVFTGLASGQGDKKYVRKGNREYEKNKFAQSEISYRRAADKNKSYPDAVFNIGDALYRQNKFDDAGKEFMDNVSMNEKKDKKAASFYNLGNSMLKSNKLKESIEAYENSLKLQPGNMEAKYNLAYAQDLLKKQEEQQKQQQDKQSDKNNKDQNKQNQQKNDQDQNKNQDQNNQQEKQNQQQQQPPEQAISKEDAERLLNSIANDEKNVQEKVKLAEAAKTKVRTLKNW